MVSGALKDVSKMLRLLGELGVFAFCFRLIGEVKTGLNIPTAMSYKGCGQDEFCIVWIENINKIKFFFTSICLCIHV